MYKTLKFYIKKLLYHDCKRYLHFCNKNKKKQKLNCYLKESHIQWAY